MSNRQVDNNIKIQFVIQIKQNESRQGAVIVQWIHLCLPSCYPGFETQAHHLHFYQIILICVMRKKTKINIGIGPFKNKTK